MKGLMPMYNNNVNQLAPSLVPPDPVNPAVELPGPTNPPPEPPTPVDSPVATPDQTNVPVPPPAPASSPVEWPAPWSICLSPRYGAAAATARFHTSAKTTEFMLIFLPSWTLWMRPMAGNDPKRRKPESTGRTAVPCKAAEENIISP